jgi:ribosome maturation factor RimP
VDLEKIRGAAERVARSEGLEIVDVEWKVGKQRFLRVYIDKVPGGREAVNTPKPTAAISDALEEIGTAEVAHDPYPKISHSDCQRVSQQLSVIRGRLAKRSTSEPVGEAKFFEGRLAGFADGKVRMELKGKDARTVEVPLEAIRKANLVVEF